MPLCRCWWWWALPPLIPKQAKKVTLDASESSRDLTIKNGPVFSNTDPFFIIKSRGFGCVQGHFFSLFGYLPPGRGRALCTPQNCVKTRQEPMSMSHISGNHGERQIATRPLFVAPVSFAEKSGAIMGGTRMEMSSVRLSPIVAQHWGFQRARPLAGGVGGRAPHKRWRRRDVK
jgi:hypothetical protein